MYDLQNLTALVTGGNKGVGRGIVYRLLEHGANVCIFYNSSQSFAEETLARAEEIRPGGAMLFQGDVSRREDVKAAVETTIQRFGALDILVNNAALQPNLVIDEYDADTFKRIWDINIGGYFIATQECLPHLKQSKNPRIINVSSVHGMRPCRFDAGYSMTKSAIRAFTRESAVELAQYKIMVNCITMGACRIEQKTGNFAFKSHWTQAARQRNSYPLGILHPHNVGDLAVYLASPQSYMLTGASIRLDGATMLL